MLIQKTIPRPEQMELIDWRVYLFEEVVKIEARERIELEHKHKLEQAKKLKFLIDEAQQENALAEAKYILSKAEVIKKAH